MNAAMAAHENRTSRAELLEKFDRINEPSPGQDDSKVESRMDVIDDSLVLFNSTELSYRVPANTTLIQVLGPVGTYNKTSEPNRCYAAVDPHAPWWGNKSFPRSWSYKLRNDTNRTMFLLPVDPAVDTTVKIGALGDRASCRVSGFKSYPFH